MKKSAIRKLPQPTKPDFAPNPGQANVIFKSGQSIGLMFTEHIDLLSFQGSFENWVANGSDKKLGGTFHVNSWSPRKGPIKRQMITIEWDTVAAINLAY